MHSLSTLRRFLCSTSPPFPLSQDGNESVRVDELRHVLTSMGTRFTPEEVGRRVGRGTGTQQWHCLAAKFVVTRQTYELSHTTRFPLCLSSPSEGGSILSGRSSRRFRRGCHRPHCRRHHELIGSCRPLANHLTLFVVCTVKVPTPVGIRSHPSTRDCQPRSATTQTDPCSGFRNISF